VGLGVLVAALLVVLVGKLSLSVRQESITWDEGHHLYAGYRSLKLGDYGLNPEVPPLVKMVAALPILGMPLHLPALAGRTFKNEAFLGGKDFIFKNDADRVLFRARMAVSTLMVVLALLVFLAGREMFGADAGLTALALVVFDPNFLAIAPIVTTDVGFACLVFATIYAFYRYVKKPSLWRLALVGLVAGLALASKHSAPLIFPMLALLATFEVVWGGEVARSGEREGRGRKSLQMAGALVATAAIAVGVLWAFYGFRYAARPDGLTINPPMKDWAAGLKNPRDADTILTLARWRVLPESYLYGLIDTKITAETDTSYLWGRVYPHGNWWYLPVVIAVKSTLPFLALIVIAAMALITRRLRRWREVVFLVVPAAVYLAVAMASDMNIGARHILPVYPFLYLLGAGALWTLVRVNRRWLWAVVVLVMFQAITSLRCYPVYMAYANEAWGGPAATHKYLSDANVDWGQQLKSVKMYLDRRGMKDCWFAYFPDGVVDVAYYGIPCKRLPTTDTLWWLDEPTDVPAEIDGPVLISDSDLEGIEFGEGALNPYEQFRHIKPTTVIDYGVDVYDGHFAIPLAAGLNHAQKASDLLEAKKLDAALAEAQAAVALAPESVNTQAALGDVLAAMGRRDEARAHYEKALTLAKTVEPALQTGWVSAVEKKLAE